MFKVECPGCKSSYNVDERRVPEKTGMKMRCPRCQSSFVVRRPGEGAGAAQGAPPPSSRGGDGSAAPGSDPAGAGPSSRPKSVPPPKKKVPDLDPTVIRPRPVIAPGLLPGANRDPAGSPRTRTAALNLDDLPVVSAPTTPDPKSTAPLRKQTTLGLGTGKEIQLPSTIGNRSLAKNADRNRTRPNTAMNTDRARTLPRPDFLADNSDSAGDEEWDLPSVPDPLAASAPPPAAPAPIDDFPVLKGPEGALGSAGLPAAKPGAPLLRPTSAGLAAARGGPGATTAPAMRAQRTPAAPAVSTDRPPRANPFAGPSGLGASSGSDQDLPVTARPNAVPVSAPAASAGQDLDFELDLGLPVVRGTTAKPGQAGVARPGDSRGLGESELPVVSGGVPRGAGSVSAPHAPPPRAPAGPAPATRPTTPSAPAVRAPSPGPTSADDLLGDDPFAGVGLPIVSSDAGAAGGGYLPATAAPKPAAAAEAFELDIPGMGDLPSPQLGETGLLPSHAGAFDANLPTAAGLDDPLLPAHGGAGAGLLPTPAPTAAYLPSNSGGSLELELARPVPPPAAPGGLPGGGFGDPARAHPHAGAVDDDPLGFGLNRPADAGDAAAGAGLEMAEVGGGVAARPVGGAAPFVPAGAAAPGAAAGDEGLEFGIPAAGSTEAPRKQTPLAVNVVSGRAGRGLRIAAVGTLLAVVAGGALTFTPYGAFGYFALHDMVKASTFASLSASTGNDVRGALAKDSAVGVDEVLGRVDAALAKEPRARAVAAWGAYAGFLRVLRFGQDVHISAHAEALLSQLPDDAKGLPYETARAARSAASAQGLARSRTLADGLVKRYPKDPDVLVLAGEIELLAKDFEKAKAHFTALADIEKSPRAQFGLARTLEASGDLPGAVGAAQRTLTLAPNHAGARLLLAQRAWDDARDELTALKLAQEIVKDPAVKATAGAADLIATHALIGQIHLARSRVSQAEASFNEAIKLQPKAPAGLLGLGETLYRSGRFADALARFNAAMEADPESVPAKVGSAKTKIALERLQEARDMLRTLTKKLKETKKESFEALTWQGRAEEAIGDRPAAEASYVEAIRVGGTNADVIDAYVSLSQMLAGLGRPTEAVSKLEEARAKLPKSGTMFRALGEMALLSGRHEDAVRELGEAIALDENDTAARFKLGVARRRMGQLEAAAAAFDKVAAADPEYPGLLLERALLLEQSGQAAKALELFEAALAKAPTDPDMMLRVAAALLASEQPAKAQRAEELARKVVLARPNSAEANHYLGRALLFRGTNLAEALRYLKRAADLDGNRAEYHLYVGWAANVADNQAAAQAALEKALELDKSLADAYWQRGVLRRRQRAVVDAERDLLKALELRPSRFEAYATLAEVYEDQQKWPSANAAWAKAIAADGTRAQWRFRYGKLLSHGPDKAGALTQLTEAVHLATVMQPQPAWLGEACLLLADAERAAHKNAEAIEHYQRFLSLAPPDSPYRKDAAAALRALGAPPSSP
jgi:cellulose synthase operon protein C